MNDEQLMIFNFINEIFELTFKFVETLLNSQSIFLTYQNTKILCSTIRIGNCQNKWNQTETHYILFIGHTLEVLLFLANYKLVE